jgi:hypothetical protein
LLGSSGTAGSRALPGSFIRPLLSTLSNQQPGQRWERPWAQLRLARGLLGVGSCR